METPEPTVFFMDIASTFCGAKTQEDFPSLGDLKCFQSLPGGELGVDPGFRRGDQIQGTISILKMSRTRKDKGKNVFGWRFRRGVFRGSVSRTRGPL